MMTLAQASTISIASFVRRFIPVCDLIQGLSCVEISAQLRPWIKSQMGMSPNKRCILLQNKPECNERLTPFMSSWGRNVLV